MAIEDCERLKYKSFVPGEWAMDNSALYTLFIIINNMRPKSILEFGLGKSLFMIHQYDEFYEDVKQLTVEHDNEWIYFFCGSILK